MKTLYLDCGMGAAGDMLAGALYELCPDGERILQQLNRILSGRAEMNAVPDVKCGVEGTHIRVVIQGDEEGKELHHHHHHTSIREIRDFLAAAPVSEKVHADALRVYDLIAAAEADVHGASLENIHFHEVGSIDAVADVLAVCLLMEALSPAQILASAVNVGGGTVTCAHGVLPVPAPATERLLRGLPWYESEIKSELCTPTGAALLRHFVTRFCTLPVMESQAVGFGTGAKDFPRMNAVRAMLGNAE